MNLFIVIVNIKLLIQIVNSVFFFGVPDSLCLKVRDANASNFLSGSIGVRVELKGVGLIEVFELQNSLEQAFPFTFAHLHIRDDPVDLEAVVDQGELFDRVLSGDSDEVRLVGVVVFVLVGVVGFFYHG